MSENFIISFDKLSKSYSGVQVLFDISFGIQKGKVTALIGENGAGKTTLMKVVAGEEPKDSGKIFYKEGEVHFRSPLESQINGVSMIHQIFSLIPEMTVAENIFLGREPEKGRLFLDSKSMNTAAVDVLATVGLHINPTTKVKDLSYSQMQLVEIAKAISHKSDVIIMDEPTSALEQHEVEILFSLVRKFIEQGKSVIFITHKLDEMFTICDEIIVLRDGHFIGKYEKSKITKDEVITQMVNRKISDVFPKRKNQPGDVALEVRNLSTKGKFSNISFSLRYGEILGFAGLIGSGRTEVAESIFGIEHHEKGEVIINGKPARVRSPKDVIRGGVGMVPDDRKTKSLVLCRNTVENINLCSYGKNARNRVFLDHKSNFETAKKYVDLLGIKTKFGSQMVENLSGGNQQKVSIAKWLANDPNIIIMDEPTQGIDVGAKMDIYQLVTRLAEEGKAILFISSEQAEIVGLCDRVLVFHEGEIRKELTGGEISQSNILKFSTI